MRYFLTCVLILLTTFGMCIAQSTNKAYKLIESETNGGGSCSEYFFLADLFDELQKQPGSTGLIVIYAGDKKERFGNAMAYAKGARAFIDEYIGAPPAQISVVIAEGRNLFNEEFWIIPKGTDAPDVRPATLNWDELTEKYHFSTSCLECEPSYASLTDFQPNFEDFAAILEQHHNLTGLVTVNSRSEAKQVSEQLTVRLKLPRERYRIQISKTASDDLFIIPKNQTPAALVLGR